MRALVTGAAGFLGGRVVSDLLCRGAAVRCLLRPSSSDVRLRTLTPTDTPGRLEIVRGQLSRPDVCAKVLEGCDTVYHVAAEMTGATAVLFMGNVVTTRVLLEAACSVGIRRFVLVSSLGVYGTADIPTGGSLDESCPLDPNAHLRDPYSYSKVAQERVAWRTHAMMGLPLVVVRPGVIYGPGRDCLTGRVGLRLGNFMLVMGGRQEMPYTHVANCAQAVVLAGEVAGVEGQAFNVVDDELPTGRQLLKRYRAEVGRLRHLRVPSWAIPPLSGLCEWYHRQSRGQLPAVLTRYKSQAMWRSLHYPNERAKRGLGWRPEVALEAGLQETLAWLRENSTRTRGRAEGGK
jgi:nucleoside-diphosphate-sugar epimerase